MNSFHVADLILACFGGLLIAFASSLNLLLCGRITGMSGIFNSLITCNNAFYLKSSLVSGLIMTSGVLYNIPSLTEGLGKIHPFESSEEFDQGVNNLTLLLAGFLVGLGSNLANGCTSGHGICGLPRLNPRSFIAVLTFMTTGFLMANLKYYTFPVCQQKAEVYYDSHLFSKACVLISLLIISVNLMKNKRGILGSLEIIVSFIVGALFALGLILSGLVKKSNVEGFLTFKENWNPSLLLVMCTAVLINLVSFNYFIHILRRPLVSQRMHIPKNNTIDKELIVGASLFGLGWGLAGICPGPAMINIIIHPYSMTKFLGGMASGQYLGSHFQHKNMILKKGFVPMIQKIQ